MALRGFWIVALALGVGGCSSWKLSAPPQSALGADSPPPSDAAKVCVIRTAVVAIAMTFPTRDNGALVGATSGPTYFCYLAEPGEHEIVIEADDRETARLSAEAGKSYFLEQKVDFIFGYVRCRAAWVSADEAWSLVRSSYPGTLVAVPGAETLPPAVPFARARHATSHAPH